jgi:predicted permease
VLPELPGFPGHFRKEVSMQTLSAVIPVLLVIALGMVLRRRHWVSRTGIDDIKFLVSRILLPVAIFNALSTAEYSMRTWITVAVILVIEVATFGAGFLLKRTFHDSTARYIPYLVSLYEGGMLAYPLYATICGQNALSNIAVIDIAGELFGFSIWMGMLQQQESGEKTSPSSLLRSALHTPAFVAALLGVVVGLLGWTKALLQVPAGAVYTSCETILTAPMNCLILLAVGYDISLNPAKIRRSIRPLFCRLIVQICAASLAALAVARLFPGNQEMVFAAIMYMAAPTTFAMQTYVRDPEGSEFVSTTNSLYVAVTILAYAVLAALYRG